MHVNAPMRDDTTLDLVYRATDIWRKIDQRWVVIHEHASMPVDPTTARADLTSAL
jgi:ketosteroid isomerase-like protein